VIERVRVEEVRLCRSADDLLQDVERSVDGWQEVAAE
jgi:hypothetical protein